MIRFIHMIIVLFMLNGLSYGQSVSKANNKIKGMYMYQFAKNVDWPKEFKSGDFVIGVYGNQELFDQINTLYSGKPVGSQSIKVEFFDNSSAVNKCHILYIAPDNSSKTSELAKKMSNHKTLIVSDGNGTLSNGAIINFVIKDTKIAYEISKKNADKSDLIIGQVLTKLATNIM